MRLRCFPESSLKTWTMMETLLGTTGAIVGMIAFTLLS
ncbi:Low-affinity gluconate/H+ symporter GntU [Cronobacter sakazakii 696]|nr:Low-affinity gluconate/H+ symporter GntU [Cronobacter sakazakii 696]